VAVLEVTGEARVVVVVSEGVAEDFGEVVAGVKEIVGRFPGAATIPTRGSRSFIFGEVSRRAHDTQRLRPRAFLATDEHGLLWLRKDVIKNTNVFCTLRSDFRNPLPDKVFLANTLRTGREMN